MAIPLEWMKAEGETQVNIADKFGITQQALSMKLSGDRPWKPEEALIWEKISKGAVTRDEVLFSGKLRKASQRLEKQVTEIAKTLTELKRK